MSAVAVATRDLWTRRQISGGAVALVTATSLGTLLVARGLGVGDTASLQTFALLFIAISVEALPFVLLGAFVAALVEVFASDAIFARFSRVPRPLQLPAGALAGFAFPVCECGSVPVARRFMHRGIAPTPALAFMLAAPVFNPIVLASTWVAYSPRGVAVEMMAGRAVMSLVLAIAVAWALGSDATRELLRHRADDADDDDSHHEHQTVDEQSRGQRFASHFTGDFFFMGQFVVIGALLSATLQTVMPRSIISGVAGSVLISTVALMAIAFISSLCSQADAFVAVSFSPFPLGAQLGFLIFGPVLDFKLALLYGGTFRKRFVIRLALVAVPVVVAGSLWFEALVVR